MRDIADFLISTFFLLLLALGNLVYIFNRTRQDDELLAQNAHGLSEGWLGGITNVYLVGLGEFEMDNF